MARNYAPLLTSIWTDGDFRALPSAAQRLYMLIISQPDLNACGVVPWRPKMWAAFAEDTTGPRISKAGRLLADRQYIILDEATDEVWVRTFLRHDGVLTSPNMFKSAARSFDAVHSPIIREAIREALPKGLREGFPKGFLDTHPKRLGELLKEALREGLLDHSLSPNPEPRSLNPEPRANETQAPPAGGEPDLEREQLFASFWDAYPKKLDKAEAEKAFNRALRTANVEDVADGLTAWVRHWAIEAEQRHDWKQFVPYPATWLNKKRWLDDPQEIAA